MDEHVLYVYGIVRASCDAASAPAGLDAAPVTVEAEAVAGRVGGRVAALASRLDAATYAGGTAEARAGDMVWIGPRAVAHDAVLTWASDASGGAVVPFPMFTLFSDAAALGAMLADQGDAFSTILDRVAGTEEYTVRAYRLDRELAEVLGALSPRVSALERQAASASPGQRYLLERKLEGERRDELRRVGERLASESYDVLAARSVAAVRDPVLAARREGSRGDAVGAERAVGRAVLDASFLVRRDAVDAFRAAAAALAAAHEERGFRFELTGPWPPYHFVGASGG